MKRVALKLLLIAAMLYPAMVFADDRAHDALFRIERNKNANIVQYDARVAEDGKLDSKQPVVGYWIRLADKGYGHPGYGGEPGSKYCGQARWRRLSGSG